ncbi:hypothetical protein KI387_008835, partial [Taxus chinensis]
YIKGKENRVVDALSRRKHISALITLRNQFKDEVKSASESDIYFQQVKVALAAEPKDERYKGFHFDNEGILRYENR